MLRELVAHGVHADFVVGSSVGALDGGYFAGDPTAAAVARPQEIWRGLKRQDVFPVTLRRLAGLFFASPFLIDACGLRRPIERHLTQFELENAARPMHIAATEILSGASVQLSSGPAIEAILANCAMLAAFPPVRIGKDLLIDGAIASNTPLSLPFAWAQRGSAGVPPVRVCTAHATVDGR
jgi:NTE family protein